MVARTFGRASRWRPEHGGLAGCVGCRGPRCPPGIERDPDRATSAAGPLARACAGRQRAAAAADSRATPAGCADAAAGAGARARRPARQGRSGQGRCIGHFRGKGQAGAGSQAPQKQIDLTERKRQEEAEQKLRLAKQQEEEDAKKKQAAAQQAAQAEREKKIADIRRQREQADKEAKLAEQKLRQVAAARAQQASSAAAATAQPTAGQGGTNTDLSAKYAAAIQQKVLAQWVRPPSVPPGQKCTINIRQLPGGQVMEAKVAPGCPYDEAGQRSIEAAVLSAQPLPYRGFESVFQRNLTFVFTAQDQ